MDLQTKVRNIRTGELGVVVADLMNCCGPNEVPVVYEGSAGFLGTDADNLESLGPENAEPDLKKCGAGKGPDCCIFLTTGPAGPCCERFGSLRYSLIFKTGMSAQRNPSEPWPDCMNQETE